MEFYNDCKRSTETDFDWGLDETVKKYLTEQLSTKLPKDLRDKNGDWWTIPKQGFTSSCVGYALAQGVLWYHLYNSQRLSEAERALKPSSRFIWEAAKEMDSSIRYPSSFLPKESTSLKAGLRILRKYGCLLEEDYPILGRWPKGGLLSTQSAAAIYTKASIRRITAYINLVPKETNFKILQNTLIENVNFWLQYQGPVALCMATSDQFNPRIKDRAYFRGLPPRSMKTGLHAVSIVGMDQDLNYIVRNSWGSSWGDKGYCYCSYDYLFGDGSNTGAVREAYGIVF